MSDTITDMPIHPKIASGRRGVEVGTDPPRLQWPLTHHIFWSYELSFPHQMFFLEVCVCIHRRSRITSCLLLYRDSEEACRYPANTPGAGHDSFQGCFRLLQHKLERKCFMEIEPQQLSKWDFFFSLPPFPSFSPLLFPLNSSPRAL